MDTAHIRQVQRCLPFSSTYMTGIQQTYKNPLLVRFDHDKTRYIGRWSRYDKLEELQRTRPPLQPNVNHGAVEVVLKRISVRQSSRETRV